MEHIRCCTVNEKRQFLPGAAQAAVMLKGQSSKLFSLRPSVSEKCQSVFHLVKEEN